MFENLLYQGAANLLCEDIRNNALPSSILLSGPEASGKLTCALEIARILSCEGQGEERGNWLCGCPSCRRQKELSSTNLIIAGPRDCYIEILAARRALLDAAANNLDFMSATRYLFIRAVRKLTLRFSPVVWENDDKLSKLSPVVEEINEQLELISPELPLPPNDSLSDITEKIAQLSKKLESTYLYDSMPIEHIRKASFWAHLKSAEGKKVLVIENADRMNESCRNALLKILEEPPEDALFILTTSRRGAVMPTILSRVRTYSFVERSREQQTEVIKRVFHDDAEKGRGFIREYLQTFLPVAPDAIRKAAFGFYEGVRSGRLPRIEEILSQCGGFEPRTLFKLFLKGVLEAQRDNAVEPGLSAINCEMELKNISFVRDCCNNVCIYNQKPAAALEKLYRDMVSIRNMF